MTRLDIKESSRPKKAKSVIKVQDVFLASEQDRAIFFDAIAKNEMPNKALRDAAMRYADELSKK